ncbi:MAG: GAF domain-containing protein [Solirubrobacteraceae bacterium]
MPSAALREAQLRRLIEAGQSIVAQLDVDGVLEELLDVAREVTGARFAAIGVLAATRRELERFITKGIDDETHEMIGDLPRGRGILGVLISDPRPLRLNHVSEDPRSFGIPDAHPPMHTFLGVPILVRGEAWGNLYLTEKEDGEPFTEADEQAAVILAAWAAVAMQNARLYQDVDARRDALERVMQTLEATSAIARAVGGERDVERVLELIVERARSLVDARAVVIALQTDAKLVVAAGAGEFDDRALGRTLAGARETLGVVLRDRCAARIRDVATDLGLAGHRIGVDGARSALLVPLVFRDRPLGVLAAFDRRGHDPQFGAAQEALLQSFAASAATAVATARTVERDRLRRSIDAAELERRRWARELHDDTLQGLGALRMLLSGALRGDEERLRATVERAITMLGTQVDDLRGLITELRPAALDDLGLQAALESLTERFAVADGPALDAHITLDGEAAQRLDPELETTVYRVVQEALHNVRKHAGATRAKVRVWRATEHVLLEVSDDGRGFAEDDPSTGFGLVGMRERVELAGGTLEVRTQPGGGTVISARLPLRLLLDEPVVERVPDELGTG